MGFESCICCVSPRENASLTLAKWYRYHDNDNISPSHGLSRAVRR